METSVVILGPLPAKGSFTTCTMISSSIFKSYCFFSYFLFLPSSSNEILLKFSFSSNSARGKKAFIS